MRLIIIELQFVDCNRKYRRRHLPTGDRLIAPKVILDRFLAAKRSSDQYRRDMSFTMISLARSIGGSCQSELCQMLSASLRGGLLRTGCQKLASSRFMCVAGSSLLADVAVFGRIDSFFAQLIALSTVERPKRRLKHQKNVPHTE